MMTTIPIDQLADRYADALKRMAAGERVVLERNGQPVAELRPLTPCTRSGRRPCGLAAGDFETPDDFDTPLPDDLLNEFER